MINLFKISPHDVSIVYLGNIFGSVSGVIKSPDAQFGVINIFSTMFKVFNGVVLALAVLMLVYVTVVGVISTAHEGEFMGKKWNNIWIPIRAVLGFALLVPTGAGYCGIQIIMMWVIVQGIGAADVVWNTALSYIEKIGVYPQIVLPDVVPQDKLPDLFQALSCDAVTKFAGPKEYSKGKYYCSVNNTSPCSTRPERVTIEAGKGNKVTFGPNGMCGSLTFQNPSAVCSGSDANSLKCMSVQKQAEALQAIVPTLSGIAISLAEADAAYRDFYNTSGSLTVGRKPEWNWIYQYCSSQGISAAACCVQTAAQRAISGAGAGGGMAGLTKACTTKEFPPPNQSSNPQSPSSAAVDMFWQFYPQLGPALGVNTPFIRTAVNYYMDNLQSAYTNFIVTQGQNQSNLSGLTRDAAERGWILAGAFYFALANETGKDFKNAMPTFEVEAPDATMLVGYRDNIQAATKLITASRNAAKASGASRKTGKSGGASCEFSVFSNLPSVLGTGDVDDAICSGFETVNKNTGTSSGTVGGGTNPLQQLSVSGNVMLSVAPAIFFILMGVTAALAIAGNITPFIWGNAITNPLGPGWEVLLIFLYPLIYGIIGLLITMGALEAIYVPLIPFTIFLFGAIHWLISVVETMVAGPLVALGIISPSGQHELLGKAEPALMLLFNVFLRPVLMIFGLIAAMLLASVVQGMIDSGWGIVKGASNIDDSLIGLIIALFVYVMLVIAALNKCFAVINLLPSQVMRWIGHQAEAVETPLDQLKAGMEQGAGVTKAGAEGYQATAKETGKEQAEAAREYKKGDEFGKSGGAKGGTGGLWKK